MNEDATPSGFEDFVMATAVPAPDNALLKRNHWQRSKCS